MEHFYDPKFNENLNSNKFYLLLKTLFDLNEDIFRIEPDDYLTLTANV